MNTHDLKFEILGLDNLQLAVVCGKHFSLIRRYTNKNSIYF